LFAVLREVALNKHSQEVIRDDALHHGLAVFHHLLALAIELGGTIVIPERYLFKHDAAHTDDGLLIALHRSLAELGESQVGELLFSNMVLNRKFDIMFLPLPNRLSGD